MSLAARLCPKTREYDCLASYTYIFPPGPPVLAHIANLGGVSNREKKHRRNRFDTCEAVHEAEYNNVKRPVDPRTKKTIEPAHKLDVSLEPDHFTKEKYCWNL